MSETPMDATARERALGHGPALRELEPGAGIGFDLSFALTGANGRRDLAWVRGVEALAQDLRVALMTPTGNDPLNVLFGFDGMRALTQALEPPLVLELLKLSLVRTLASDRRIRQVLTVKVTPPGPATEARLTRKWTASADLLTVLGQSVTVNLREVLPHD